MKCDGHYPRRNMKSLAILQVIFLLQKCSSFYYTDQYGLIITYDVTFVSKCRTEAGRVRSMIGIGLSDCVKECSLRPHCGALSYRRKMCNLFTATNGGNHDKGDCIYISATDIKVEKKPCGNCSYGQVCDRHLKDCKYEECLNASINNGVVLGNRKEVGKKIRYKCNHGYRDRNGVESAVCQENGAWNATANCIKVCSDLPTISNGIATLDKINGNLYMDTATVTCDTGYLKSVDTVQCTASGDWPHATCDPVDCGNPDSLPNGDIVLNGGTTYQNTASVTCDAGYQRSIDIISCTASESWDTVTCDLISCGNPPPIANGNIALNTGTTYMNTASVNCDTSFKANTNTITCTASGSWETAICKDCYIDDVRNYSGTKNITVTGYACERWDDHIGAHGTDAQHIPESSLSEIENYCRNPTGNNWPLWCFSSDPDKEWELCDIQQC